MKLSQIIIYPIKSSRGIKLQSSQIAETGLKCDRLYAVIDDRGNILTAREYPKLLQLRTQITDGSIFLDEKMLNYNQNLNASQVKLFKNTVQVLELDKKFSVFISNFLNVEASIVLLKKNSRLIDSKYLNHNNNRVSLADISPIHLISQASIENLNRRLAEEDKIGIENFRPNLVVSNCEAYFEDKIKEVQIGNCLFSVHYKSPRCSVTTIDQYSLKRNVNLEPLRTLSKYRKNKKGEVCFGVYLTPRILGEIKVGDELKILE